MSAISIFATNLGRYNEGYLVGDWIDLPMDHDELWDTVNRVCKVDPLHEEVFITDYETDSGLDIRIHEYESIDAVNALAAAIETLDPWQVDAVNAWTEYDNPSDPMGLASVCMDADHIPFHGYDAPSNWTSNEEKLGYTMVAMDYELQRVLEGHNLESYFDYEAYGRDCAYDYTLTDEGYLDHYTDSPDEELYTEPIELLEELGYYTEPDEEAA